ncbi:MAG: hypothetical protein IPK10_09660 [Bacteroidetes bacterium]|nr:hypothetical protein [Bacteroidota bacterium]
MSDTLKFCRVQLDTLSSLLNLDVLNDVLNHQVREYKSPNVSLKRPIDKLRSGQAPAINSITVLRSFDHQTL